MRDARQRSWSTTPTIDDVLPPQHAGDGYAADADDCGDDAVGAHANYH